METEARHLLVAAIDHGLVFGIRGGCLLAVAAGEARVDFVVQRAAEGFADAL